jgi:hypothetical protein
MGVKRLAAPLFTIVFVGVFGAAYIFDALGNYSHDDHMNAVAPVVMQHYAPYSIMGFDKPPLSLLLFYQVDRLVGDTNLYTVLRILSLVFNLAILSVGIILCRRDARRKSLVTVVFAGLYLWYRPTEAIGEEVGDYTLSLFCFALALLFRRAWGDRSIGAVMVGLFAGLAISGRISYIYLAIAFAIIYAVSGKKLARNLASYFIGGLIGTIPIFLYLITDFDSFIFLNIRSHYLQNVYREVDSVNSEPQLLLFSFKSSASWPLAVLTALCGVVPYLVYRAVHSWQWLRDLVSSQPLTRYETELLGLYLAALFGTVTPGIILYKYWAAPGFILFLLVCRLVERVLALPSLDEIRQRQVCVATVSIIIVVGVWRTSGLITRATQRIKDEVYGVTAVARMRETLAETIAAIDRARPGCHGEMVTAVGTPAIGAGVAMSAISGSGPFMMRLDSVFIRMAPDYRLYSDLTRYLSPNTLILSGFYDDASYEPQSPFVKIIDDYAAVNRFKAIELGKFMYKPLILYIPAACWSAD